MGLFGWKKEKVKVPDGIRIVYYDGDLPGFVSKDPCQVLLMDDALRITKVLPYVEVRLERSRILSMEYYYERDYMQRFRGNDGKFSRVGEASFFVMYYISKEGIKKRLDFWTGSEGVKVLKMIEKFNKSQPEQSYEI